MEADEAKDEKERFFASVIRALERHCGGHIRPNRGKVHHNFASLSIADQRLFGWTCGRDGLFEGYRGHCGGLLRERLAGISALSVL